MTTNVFIDGGHGTTGIEIAERLAGRQELSLIALDLEDRRNAVARRDALNAADIVILCLPDDAAREAVSLIRRLWSEERVTFEGQYYRTHDATIYDQPEEPVPLYIAAAGALVVVSLSWSVVFDLTPKSLRPYAGSSKTNSMLELAVVHNGLERFVLARPAAPVADPADAATAANATTAAEIAPAPCTARPRMATQMSSA